MFYRRLDIEHAPLMNFALARMAYNDGASLGLQYPLIFSERAVWCRYCGKRFYRGPDAESECHRLNGISRYPDAETIIAIDATP